MPEDSVTCYASSCVVFHSFSSFLLKRAPMSAIFTLDTYGEEDGYSCWPALTASSAPVSVFAPRPWTRPGTPLPVPTSWAPVPAPGVWSSLVSTSAAMSPVIAGGQRYQRSCTQNKHLGLRVALCTDNCALDNPKSWPHLSRERDLEWLLPRDVLLSFRLCRSSPFSATNLSRPFSHCSRSCNSSDLCNLEVLSHSRLRACFKKKLVLSGK